MRISRLYVDGFRHFQNQEVLLERDTTVLAGANNSGKTSLIDLLRVVLRSGKDLSEEDLSATQRFEWSRNLIRSILENKEQFLENLTDEQLVAASPRVTVRIEVTYDPKVDDIREFADFLMDLDLSKNTFYFEYRFSPKPDKLRTALLATYSPIAETIEQNSWTDVSDVEANPRTFHGMQTDLCKALVEACQVSMFYADSSFDSCVEMERSRFFQLFHFRLVKAARPLDDTIDDKSGALSQRFVDAMKDSEEWQGILDTLPGSVLKAIESTGVGELTAKAALESLNSVMSSISETNGNAKNDIFLDFQVTEEDAVGVIARAMQARYRGIGVPLGEKSQGLGYSNLIILHLEIEAFLLASIRPENAFRVNLVVIEEPESHMHPQMQNAFIKHLLLKVPAGDGVQALVTTHSSEIVRSSKIETLRVLKISEGSSKIIDLSAFHASQVATKTDEQKRLFELLYSINFADVLFADKVVMYEGDTERMYFQALIQGLDDLARLRTQYVSYVQVGGAHAHVYLPLIVDTLGIKTVVITDVDYEKESLTSSAEEVEVLETTNSTLNKLFAKKVGEEIVNPTLGELFALKGKPEKIVTPADQPYLAVAYQSGAEGYARTLEEAILSKLTVLSVWEQKPKAWWVEYRNDSGLDFSIPRKDSDISIRDIVQSTSGRKTDFMYSLILQEELLARSPGYVFDSLDWLSA